MYNENEYQYILGDDPIMNDKIISLSFLKEGESGVVYDFKGGEKFRKKLESLGIRKNKKINTDKTIQKVKNLTININNNLIINTNYNIYICINPFNLLP